MDFDDFLNLAKAEENDNLVHFNFEREEAVALTLPERNNTLQDFKDFLKTDFVGASPDTDTTATVIREYVENRIDRDGFEKHPGLDGNNADTYFSGKTPVFLKSLFDWNYQYDVLSVLLPGQTNGELERIVKNLVSLVMENAIETTPAGRTIAPDPTTKEEINKSISKALGDQCSTPLNFDRDARRTTGLSAKSKRKRRQAAEPPNSIWWLSCMEDTEKWAVPFGAASGHVAMFRAFLGLSSPRDYHVDSSVLLTPEARTNLMGRMYVHFAVDESHQNVPKSQPNPFSDGFPELWLGAGKNGGQTVQLVDESCTEGIHHANCNCAAGCLPEAVTSYQNLRKKPRKTHRIAAAYMFTTDLERYTLPSPQAIRTKATNIA